MNIYDIRRHLIKSQIIYEYPRTDTMISLEDGGVFQALDDGQWQYEVNGVVTKFSDLEGLAQITAAQCKSENYTRHEIAPLERQISIYELRVLLDSMEIPYQQPQDDLQLILRGTANLLDTLDGSRWEYYVRGGAADGINSETYFFETLDELASLLRKYNVKHPYDQHSAKPLAI